MPEPSTDAQFPVRSGARVVVVLAPAGTGSGAPPGIDARAWTRALFEDTYEVAIGLTGVVVAVAGPASDLDAVEDLTWPGTPMIVVDGERPLAGLAAALTGARAVVVLPADVPDLPGLLIGKLFRELGSADLALSPAARGGLAALGLALPPAGWVRAADPHPDSDPAALTNAAPRRSACRRGPGWHRLRGPGGVAALDPGLESWENTRALLSGRPLG